MLIFLWVHAGQDISVCTHKIWGDVAVKLLSTEQNPGIVFPAKVENPTGLHEAVQAI